MISCTVGLVEDDDVIRTNLTDFLESRGFEVQAHAGRASAEAAFRQQVPDVAVIDVALGDERDGGFRLCQKLRSFTQTLPIIFLTCHDGEADRISGLRAGGDDYLSKETSLEFLVVRLETLLARSHALLDGEASTGPESSLAVGQLAVDLRRATLCWAGTPVILPLTQFWMVVELASSPSEPKSAEALMHAANISVAPNTVAAHIRSIRQRFMEVDAEFDAIRTERGRGYRWSSSPPADGAP